MGKMAVKTSDTVRIDSIARSHVGSVRELNEDNYLESPDLGLWCVADGMGGHAAGEVASRLIIEQLRSLDNPFSLTSPIRAVESRLHSVNHQLLEQAALLQPGQIIGSTAVVLSLIGMRFTALWAGDSRLYLFRRGELRQLTRDHSVVQELVEAGALSAKEARNHRSSNIITRAIGVSRDFKLDRVEGTLHAGDLFLLCSDGLVNMLEDNEIANILAKNTPEVAADVLVATSLERTARDNITLILVKIPDGYGVVKQPGLLRRLLSASHKDGKGA
jgi:serine/threonine protein phosphatase PrpC